MTDILDEILAATESVRSQQQHLPPSCAAPGYLSPPFAPSPRGVQDDLAAFALLQPQQPPHHKKPTSVPASPPLAAPTSTAAAAAVRPTATTASSSTQATHTPLYQQQPLPDEPAYPAPSAPWAGSKRSYHSMEQRALPEYPGAPLRAQSPSHPHSSQPTPLQLPVHGEDTQPLKKFKPEPTTAVVMPPSAKSILERREKAIREGRRKDAKLTESERRILRRLRNRESAERCRLRRVQQAVQLERKIESMQVENDRLVAVADEYEKTIQRLERVIKTFTEGGKGQQPGSH